MGRKRNKNNKNSFEEKGKVGRVILFDIKLQKTVWH